MIEETRQGLVHSPRGEAFEIAGRVGPVELQRAPQVPAQAREELLVIKGDALFLCARMDGDIAPRRASGEGLYAHDTRHLSELRVEIAGVPPVALSCSVAGEQAVVDATNADLPGGPEGPTPQQSLSLTKDLTIAGGRLYCLLQVRSFLRTSVSTTISVVLASDFADIFEIRGGIRRAHRGHAMAPKRTERGVTLAYLGEDDVFRETVAEFAPAPDAVRLAAGQAEIEWRIVLEPGLPLELLVTVEPSAAGARRPRRRRRAALCDIRKAALAWERSCSRIRSDNERFEDLINRAVTDLRALTTSTPAGRILTAGIPWYVAPFGRDALIASGEAMILTPSLSLDALRTLASLQARLENAWQDAEPGKILHELRTGELSTAGITPHSPYYGTVDATPLFLIRAADYYAWTADIETMRDLRPALDAALHWIDRYGDRDGDGFIEYERRSPGGLQNQGWKDSHDALVHADGGLAEGPIALVEVQAYVYLAKQSIAEVYEQLGDPRRAEALRREADELRARFNALFWNPAEGTFALALDGHKAQVASVTSNPGHCLYCGIVDTEKAASVVDRLMAPDMFSGWGIRTLASTSPAYNPMSYHNGSVWPHDNAIIAAGMKRYGHDTEMMRVVRATLEVALRARELRLPELYCGFDRTERAAVVAYPVACIPQAWSAAAPLLLVQTMLGIFADAPRGILRIERPVLPEWLGSIQLEELRVGGASVSLRFERTGDATAFTLLDQEGALAVTMAPGGGVRS